MPGRDHTGPQGRGPLTGRKLGSCTDDSKENLSRSRFYDTKSETRMGLRSGKGMRFRGQQNRRYSPANEISQTADKEQSLRLQIVSLKERLRDMEQRLKNLE